MVWNNYFALRLEYSELLVVIGTFYWFFPLTIAVPPQKPNIIDERGKTVPAVAGPYEEGGDMRLQCLVSGGKSYFL